MKRITALILALTMVLSICSCGKDHKSADESADISHSNHDDCDHEYKEELIQPTCVTDGYTRHLCSVCDDEYISDIVYAAGHSFSEAELKTEATCQNAGENVRICSVCSYEEIEKTELASHDYKELSEENGNIAYKCEMCDRTVTKTADSELPIGAEKTLFDCDEKQAVKVSYNGSAESLKKDLDIIPVLFEGTEYDLSGEAAIDLSVEDLGDSVFSVEPTEAFEEGGTYVVRLKNNDVSFTDYPEFGRIIIRVKAEEKFELEVNEDVKFIKALNDENPGYYPYSVTASEQTGVKYASIMKVDGLNVGDVVCLGEYSDIVEIFQNDELKDDYCFGKITQIYPAEVGYILVLGQTGAKDIYKQADINYTTGIVINEEDLTEEEKESIQNAALGAVLKNEEFITYLAATESAATEYLLSRGLEPSFESIGSWDKDIGGFKFKVDYEFNNENVNESEWKGDWKLFGKEYKFKKAEIGTTIEITLTVTRTFKAKTSSGSDAGALDISVVFKFECEPRINLKYKTENDVFVDDFAEMSAELTTTNTFSLDFKVHAGIDYSLDNKPYVVNTKTGTYHCAYCHIFETNKDSSDFQKLTADKFISDTKGLDEDDDVFCGVCKPQTDLKNTYLAVNDNTKKVHIPGCSYVTSSCRNIKGLAIKYKTEYSYDMCSHCEPEKKQEDSFKGIIDSKIKNGGLEKEVAALKKGLKGIGAVDSGTAKDGKSLIKTEIPIAAVFKLMVQVDLVLDFDLNATMQYNYTAKTETRAWFTYAVGGKVDCGREETEKSTNQAVDFIGTSEARLGLNFSIGVAVVAEDIASVKMTLGVGVYAKLNGMFHYDITNSDWYGGAYFEVGTYLGVKATATIFWNAFEIPVVKNKDYPFFSLGYDEIWISFVTTPKTAEMQGDLLIMNDEDYLKIKTYNLSEMKSEEKTLSLDGGEYYDVDITFGHGDEYLTGSNGEYKVADGVTDKFTETVTVSVESNSSWNTYDEGYNEGQAISYLEPYTFTVEFTDTFLLETSSDVSLEDIAIVAHDSYKDNEGDSTVFNLNGKGLTQCDDGITFNRYGNVGVDETVFSNGFEVWIARWNYTNEISWASATFDLDGKYKTLTGKTNLIESYNTTNFDTTVYFFDGDKLLDSYRLTNSDYIKDISIDVSGVKHLKLYVKDNVAVSGGTSFALYDMFLENTPSSNTPSDPSASGKDDSMAEAYKSVLESYPESTYVDLGRYSYYKYTMYTLYDVDEDGTPELIVTKDEKEYFFYTYVDGASKLCGEYEGSYADCLYEYDGNGIAVHDGGFGNMHLEYFVTYKIVDGQLVEGGSIANTEEDSQEEMNAALESHKHIEDYYKINDYSGLY